MRSFVVFLVVFVVGGVLMGFEMLGSRFLYPYFGGGMATWAGLISTVLYALAIGYFIGGAIVDRYPSLTAVAVSGSCAIVTPPAPRTAARCASPPWARAPG